MTRQRNCESCWTAGATHEVKDEYDTVWHYCISCARQVGQVTAADWAAYEAANAAFIAKIMAEVNV